jgi:hypothetical protein
MTRLKVDVGLGVGNNLRLLESRATMDFGSARHMFLVVTRLGEYELRGTNVGCNSHNLQRQGPGKADNVLGNISSPYGSLVETHSNRL